MNRSQVLQIVIIMTLVILFLVGCGTSPTTPGIGTSPTTPGIGTPVAEGTWIITVLSAERVSEINEVVPSEKALVVTVKLESGSKGNVRGDEFVIVDGTGEEFPLAGMFFSLDGAYPDRPDVYEPGRSRFINNIMGHAETTWTLVYVISESVTDLKLRFRHYQMIELGL